MHGPEISIDIRSPEIIIYSCIHSDMCALRFFLLKLILHVLAIMDDYINGVHCWGRLTESPKVEGNFCLVIIHWKIIFVMRYPNVCEETKCRLVFYGMCNNYIVVLVSLVVKTGNSVLCWPEGLGFIPGLGGQCGMGVVACP